jgi:hypothetical protein
MRPQQCIVSAVRSVRPVHVESLEERRLCSVSAYLNNGNLVVAGDDNANAIVIQHTVGTTIVNGKSFLDVSIPKGVVVYPGLSPKNSSAADSVQIRSSVKPVEVFAGTKSPLYDAALEVRIGENGRTDGVKQTVRVHGSGQTRLVVDNNAATVAANVTLDYLPTVKVSTITGAAPATLMFDGVTFGSVDVRLGQGNDIVTVRNTSPAATNQGHPVLMKIDAGRGVNVVKVLAKQAATSLQINNTRGGYDAVVLGSAYLSRVQGAVHVGNTNGLSTIMLDDSSDTGSGQRFDLSTGKVTLLSAGYRTLDLTFDPSRISGLKVVGGDAAVTFSVQDTLHASSPGQIGITTLFGGAKPSEVYFEGTTGPAVWQPYAAYNSLNFGATNHSTAGLKGDITCLNTLKSDSILISNGAATTMQSVVIDARDSSSGQYLATITGAAPGKIRYGVTTHVSLHTGSGNDIVRILGDTRFAVTKVNTGAGNDVIWVGNAASNLNDLHGARLLLDGGDGHDRLYVIDTTAQKPATYVNFVGYFNRFGTAPIYYSNFEGFTVLK